MKLLVTGGAGYIGSVVAAALIKAGHDVTVLDDLSTGHANAVPPKASFVRGTLRDDAAPVLADGTDAVLHFAAKSLVGESVAHPDLYWSHNLGGSLALFEAMRETGVRRIVFSSTAAVYGEPERTPIEETPHPAHQPVRRLQARRGHQPDRVRPLVRLRRDEPAVLQRRRAHQDSAGKWYGERHSPETHLIPNVLKIAQSATAGTAPGARAVKIFGDDYPTPDGTCLRDYIHVADLADAHLLALDGCRPSEHQIFNLGDGAGFSVREVIDVCREVTGQDIPVEVDPRRPGDPAVLVASSQRIGSALGWHASRDLRAMVADAWTFAQGQAARAGAGALQ